MAPFIAHPATQRPWANSIWMSITQGCHILCGSCFSNHFWKIFFILMSLIKNNHITTLPNHYMMCKFHKVWVLFVHADFSGLTRFTHVDPTFEYTFLCFCTYNVIGAKLKLFNKTHEPLFCHQPYLACHLCVAYALWSLTLATLAHMYVAVTTSSMVSQWLIALFDAKPLSQLMPTNCHVDPLK